MEFDVFGRRIVVERRDNRWTCFERGADGKRRDAPFIIPADIRDDEVELYLADLYHESATPDHPEVDRIR